MPLVPMRAILEATEKYNYAQGAFNVNAVAQAKAVIEVHEMFRSAAIIQGADLANAFMGGRTDFANGTLEDKKVGANNIANAVKKYGEHSSIPIALHLDHGKSIEACLAAMDGGYTSVMIDGSHLPFEQNMELTREVVKLAHPRGVTVEGELGVLAGVEDHVFSETSTYTNPMDAIEFVKKTGCDALAISYGTKHGANKGLRIMEDGNFEDTLRCLDEDYHTAKTIANVLIQHDARVFHTLANTTAAPKTASIAQRQSIHLKFFDALPDDFDRKTYTELATQMGLNPKSMDRVIRKWCDDGKLENVTHGKYAKVY